MTTVRKFFWHFLSGPLFPYDLNVGQVALADRSMGSIRLAPQVRGRHEFGVGRDRIGLFSFIPGNAFENVLPTLFRHGMARREQLKSTRATLARPNRMASIAATPRAATWRDLTFAREAERPARGRAVRLRGGTKLRGVPAQTGAAIRQFLVEAASLRQSNQPESGLAGWRVRVGANGKRAELLANLLAGQ